MRSQITISLILILTVVFACNNEPADFLLIIKASYYLSDDQWNSIIKLAEKVASSINLGRTKEHSQLGIALYDNLNEPKTAIEIGSYGRTSDLVTAIRKLKMLPCGSWCSEQTQKSDVEQIRQIINKQLFSRSTKIYIISSEMVDSYNIQQLIGSLQNVALEQITIPQTAGIVESGQPQYDYYRAYYDNYRRYAERMQQIYPYMSVQVPNDVYPYSSQSDQNSADSTYENWSQNMCYSLLKCQQCLESPKVELSIDANPESIHSGSSSNKGDIPINIETILPATSSSKTPVSEDYEYEITADPPGLKINNTPLKDEVKETSVIGDNIK